MNKKNFIVKPESKRVIAAIQKPVSVLEDLKKNSSHITSKVVMQILLTYDIEKSTNSNYKAIACCDERDEFDEKIGKKIASKKCDAKYHMRKVKQYKRILKILEQISNEIHHIYYSHSAKLKKIEQELEEYM